MIKIIKKTNENSFCDQMKTTQLYTDEQERHTIRQIRFWPILEQQLLLWSSLHRM